MRADSLHRIPLTMDGLGCDPTASFILSDEETERLTGKNEPSAIISTIGHEQRLCTIGPHIGTSLSLLGRNTVTHVWLVRESVPGDNKNFSSLNGDEMIMKMASRNSLRTPESMIYSSIKAPILGLAKCECCVDVIFQGATGYLMTVRNLRSDLHDHDFLCDYKDPTPKTPTFHRLILSIVGRPLWSYTTDLDFLTGLRDALQTHRCMCDEGILHRDISASNILLSKDIASPFRGFIIDFDFAYIQDLIIPQRAQPAAILQTSRQNKFLSIESMIRTAPTTVPRNARIIGTAQFMSLAFLLQALQVMKKPFVYGANDDIQSFIWVLSYCVMCNLYHRASHKDALKDIGTPGDVQVLLREFRSLFGTAFGETKLSRLVQARQTYSVALDFPTYSDAEQITERFMSEALISLFEDLQNLLSDAISHKNPIPLTHDSLLEQINKAITTLEDADRFGSSTCINPNPPDSAIHIVMFGAPSSHS